MSQVHIGGEGEAVNKNSIAPDFIKFAAVVVALPRWVLALLAADGYAVPASWAWVHAVSAVFGSAMCVLEGIAIALHPLRD